MLPVFGGSPVFSTRHRSSSALSDSYQLWPGQTGQSQDLVSSSIDVALLVLRVIGARQEKCHGWRLILFSDGLAIRGRRNCGGSAILFSAHQLGRYHGGFQRCQTQPFIVFRGLGVCRRFFSVKPYYSDSRTRSLIGLWSFAPTVM